MKRVALLLLLACVLGCAGYSPLGATRPPARISDVADEGDATRRASQRLVAQGLDEDGVGNERQAQSLYERALSIDPTNPFAYLALSRHYVEHGRYTRSLEYLDQAEILLGSEEPDSPRVAAHLAGIRGAAYVGLGREREGRELLDYASSLAPSVWADGGLSPSELR